MGRLNDDEYIQKEFAKGFKSPYVRTFSSRVKNIRGTQSYWFQMCQNLISAIDDYGAPTIFFTLSAADYHWIELQRLMPWPKSVTQNGLSKLSIAQKKEMVVKNPHIATWFFKTKLDLLMATLKPILGIKHFWLRIESQHRGSDHCHGAIWLRDDPGLTKLSNTIKLGHIASEKIKTLYAHYLFCTLCF